MTASPITSYQEFHLDDLLSAALKRALREVNPDREGLQRLFSRGGEFQDYFVAGIHRFCALAPDYVLAKKILGGDFVTPEEIMMKCGVSYSPEQIMTLGSQLPSENMLRHLKENGFALVAPPPVELSLLDIRAHRLDLFYYLKEGWYSDKREKFSREDKTSFAWLMIRKTQIPNSTYKKWNEQQLLLAGIDSVPNVAEMAWFITTFYEVRGVRLFQGDYVRTSSLCSDNCRVNVGGFGTRGLAVSRYAGDRAVSYLGIACARKF